MRNVAILARFHLLSVWNWRTSYLSRLIEAPVYYLFLVAGLATLNDGQEIDGLNYEEFAFAGVLVVIAIRGLFWAMGDVANDRKWGIYAISRTLDASLTHYVGSVLCANGIVALAQIVAILVLKQIVAADALLQDLAMSLLALLVSLVALLAGCVLGFRVDSYSKRDLLTSVFSLPLVLTAPLFYSLAELPLYMRLLAALNPFTYGVLIVRWPAGGELPLLAITGVLVVTALLVGLLVADRDHELISVEQG